MNINYSQDPHASSVSETLSINKLHVFFKEAFLPNQEEFHHISSIEDFKIIPKSKEGFLRTLVNVRPGCPRDNLNILDLACGDTPFLRKLIDQHDSNECSTDKCDKFANVVAKKVRYVAVDLDFPYGYRTSLKPLLEKLNKCFEFIPYSIDLSKSSHLELLLSLKGDKPFDMIILSNALHELSPESWPELLSLIPELINDNGIFLFLDLTNPMGLIKKTKSFESIITEKSYWEADAIYCLWSHAIEIGKKMGMNVTPSFGHDGTEPYWYMQMKKKENISSREDRKLAISLYLKEFVTNRLNDWKIDSKSEREKVINEFRENPNEVDKLIFLALRYLCLCASDTRMRESLIQLDLEEAITNKLIKNGTN